ncbi:MAG: endonuclease [Bacteroidaceae bacterium]|nr:endonuclease [Bacteroidaceae bacterium]
MRRRLLLTHLLLVLTLWVGAASFDKATYYSAAKGKKGSALKTALAGIIYTSNSVGYDGLKAAYKKTDVRSDGYLYDMYSNETNYVAGSAYASSYKEEGDGYNREHTIPQSLFNEAAPMKADLYHVYPIDAALNGERGNYCHGEVNTSAAYGKSSGGFSKWGSPSTELTTNGCEEGKVFEPNDEYKGDFARTYFYFVTCYQTKMTSMSSYGMFNKTTYPSFSDWAKTMLLKWAKNDPVSTKETTRIEAVYATAQGNRNPFIDFPGLEQYIWGDYTNVAFDPSNYQNPYDGTSTTPSISLSQASATLQVGSTLTLTATKQNAGSASVQWKSSNSGVASVSGGVVTALAAGSTTITASMVVNSTTYSATCNVTVTENSAPVVGGDYYVKVASSADIAEGQYLIVYEDGSYAFNGGLSKLDAANNVIRITIADDKIDVSNETEAAEFTLVQYESGYSVKSKSGIYMGSSSASNSITEGSTPLLNTLSVSTSGDIDIKGTSGYYLRFNTSTNNGIRFRYYASGKQNAIQLYKKVVIEVATLPGDVNRDGEVTIADVTALVNIILGKDTAGYDLEAADVNEDGERTIADVTALVNIILGKKN